jgi:hypothetical protein
MAYGVLVQEKVMALNIDSLNRSCYSASSIENGMVFNLLSKVPAATLSSTGSEVWLATQPLTGSLVNLWMAYEPEVVVTISGTQSFKGIDPDPRNFVVPTGTVFSAFKPQIGDLLLMTADAITGTPSSTNDWLNATTEDYQLNAATDGLTPGTGLTLKYQATSYISIGTGSIGTQRVTAYKFEVVAN